MATSQTQIFLDLRISGNRILGESTIQDYEDQIEVDAFKFDLKVKATSPKQGQTKLSTRVQPTELKITKLFDRSSANLARYAAQQFEFDSAKITVNQHQHTDSGAHALPMLTIELWEGVIKSVNLTMSGSGKASTLKEEISLTWKEVSFNFHSGSTDRLQRGSATNFNCRVQEQEA
ncbi:MAG TPA: type VI secretion system tube protein Hcp [Rubrivivax sp.]|nr:type VI secretion system tube protein Hcp [Rubrivivax sp.]